jgi:hypothetical protein
MHYIAGIITNYHRPVPVQGGTMASWGEFIAEIPIINKRSEGIFVKVDHVLDLWAERNQLRAELGRLNGNICSPESDAASVSPALVAPVVEDARLRETAYLERERCAQEVENLLQSYPAEAEQRELIGQVLRAVARSLRHKDDEETAEFLANVEIPPAQAETVEIGAESVPFAVPIAEPVDDSVSER